MSASARAAVAFFRGRFRALGKPARAEAEKKYLKSALSFHGVTMPELRATSGEWCKAHLDVTREELHAIVDALYETEFHDLRSVAVALLEKRIKLAQPADAAWLLDLIRRSANWAHVDWLATSVLGRLFEAHPRLDAKLRAWARDSDFWVRRTALLVPLRRLRTGGGDFALFAELAAPMLEEKEFFIRKAIGWVLREVSKKRPALVHAFLKEHGARASGLTRREATKYLPAAMAADL